MLMDGTFGTNKWKFCLTTMMVVTPENHGIPVAFFIHSSQTSAVMTQCLDALARHVGAAQRPAVVVVDDAAAEIAAIEESVWRAPSPPSRPPLCPVYLLSLWAPGSLHRSFLPDSQRGRAAGRGRGGSKVFLCVWHVKRAWLKNLKKKVSDYTHRRQLLAELSAVLECMDLTQARGMFQKLVTAWARPPHTHTHTTLPHAFFRPRIRSSAAQGLGAERRRTGRRRLASRASCST